MSQNLTTAQTEQNPKTIFGFWVYLMTDCVLFASLFATFVVLRHNTYGGPTGGQIFNLTYVLAQTLILLTSSFTCGLAIWAAYQKRTDRIIKWLIITFLLGLAFLALEINEFNHLYQEGNSWRRSGFLSAYFTLVGTHGLHITAGLIWMAVMMRRVLKQGLSTINLRRLTALSLFWHFLDIIWIFIFTIVYLTGAIKL